MKFGLAAALVAAMAMTTPAVAKKSGADFTATGLPGGFSHGNKHGWNGGTTPPGWSKGKKHGWNGGTMPPGLSR